MLSAMAIRVTDPLLTGIRPAAARKLVVAGIEAFASRGFQATTTRDIAARAGLSPAALYIHYPSKTRLLEEIIKLGHQSALDAFESGFDETRDPAERIAIAVRHFTTWHARNQMLARVVQYELEALPSRERREISALRTQFEAMLRGEIERGVDVGEFEVSDIRGTATAIFSLCIDVARWYSPRKRRTPEDIGQLYGELALRMLNMRR